jgi:hypothetical protein
VPIPRTALPGGGGRGDKGLIRGGVGILDFTADEGVGFPTETVYVAIA